MCDLSALTIGNYKFFPSSSHEGKLPSPYQSWFIASILQFSERVIVSVIPRPAMLTGMSTFLAQVFHLKSFLSGTLAEILPSHLYQEGFGLPEALDEYFSLYFSNPPIPLAHVYIMRQESFVWGSSAVRQVSCPCPAHAASYDD